MTSTLWRTGQLMLGLDQVSIHLGLKVLKGVCTAVWNESFKQTKLAPEIQPQKLAS